MTVFCPFWNGFLIKLVNGDKGFLNNVIGDDEFDEFKFAESGEIIWEWDRLILLCGLIRIKFELLRLRGLCKIGDWVPVRRILALSASQALLKSNKDVEADLFKSLTLLLSKLNPGKILSNS